mgnify:CR=1 FL=1
MLGGGQESLAIFFDKFSKPFRLILYLYQIVALSLTVFALVKYLFVPLELAAWPLLAIYLVLIVFVILLLGLFWAYVLKPVEVLIDPTVAHTFVNAVLDWGIPFGNRVDVRMDLNAWPQHARLQMRVANDGIPPSSSTASDSAHTSTTGITCSRRRPWRSTKAFCAPMAMMSMAVEVKP